MFEKTNVGVSKRNPKLLSNSNIIDFLDRKLLREHVLLPDSVLGTRKHLYFLGRK